MTNAATKALADALTRLLEWPNPQGTIEQAYIPRWLADECRAALSADPVAVEPVATNEGLTDALKEAHEMLPKIGESEEVYCSIRGDRLRMLLASIPTASAAMGPVLFVSPKQLENHDPQSTWKPNYLPCVRRAEGLFTMPLYAAQPAAVGGREPLSAESQLCERAADMVTAYAELIAATGKYAEMHYIPEVQDVAARLRASKGTP